MKAGNTLDTVITSEGRGIVRHYLQDVGSTFGAGALGPREWDEGYEYLYEGTPMWKRLVSFGFFVRFWQTIPYKECRRSDASRATGSIRLRGGPGAHRRLRARGCRRYVLGGAACRGLL